MSKSLTTKRSIKRLWTILINRNLQKSIPCVYIWEIFCSMYIYKDFLCRKKLKIFLLYNFKLQGARQIHRELFEFSTITREFTHSVGSLTGLMLPILAILLVILLIFFFFQCKRNLSERIDHWRNWKINSYVVCCTQSSNFTKVVLIFSKYQLVDLY